MVTIRDVAKEAQVSVATVSRVLNKRGYVHEHTRVRVEGAIHKLSYRPNNVARTLFKKQSKMIGFLVPDITNPYFAQLVRVVEQVTNEAEFTTFLCSSEEDLQKELRHLEKMQENHVDGVIVISNTLEWEHLQSLDIPIVALDRTFHEEVPTVRIDNYEESLRAIQHLLDEGCTRIAHIQGPAHIANSTLRFQAYTDLMQAKGLPVLSTKGEYDLKVSEQAVSRLLEDHPDTEAIYAGNDVMAVGALKAAQRMGKRVPEDLLIMGFDGIDWTEMVTPEISTMAQPIEEMGRQAAKLLLQQIEEGVTAPAKTVLHASLLTRQSTRGKVNR